MPHPPRLNRDLIVREAIALLQEGGLDEVSLRNIAARLKVSAPSLARHVGNKRRLLGLMSRALFLAALDEIPPGLTGDAWLLAFGQALRRRQLATRDITALLATAPPVPDIEPQTGDRLRATMAQAGLEGAHAEVEQAAIQALVTGWMVFETSPRRESFARRLPRADAFEVSLKALIAGFASQRD